MSPGVRRGLPDWWFYYRKMEEFASGTIPVSDRGPKRLSGVSRRAFASSGEAQSGLNETSSGSIWVPGEPKAV